MNIPPNQSIKQALYHSGELSFIPSVPHECFHHELACARRAALSGESSASSPCLAYWNSEVESSPYLMSMLLETV